MDNPASSPMELLDPEFRISRFGFWIAKPRIPRFHEQTFFGFPWPGLRIVLHWGFNAMFTNCIYLFTFSVKKCPSCSSKTSLKDCNKEIKTKTCRNLFTDRFACAVIQYSQDSYSRTCMSDFAFTNVRAEKFGICMEDQCLANFTFTAGKLILVVAFSLFCLTGYILLTHSETWCMAACWTISFKSVIEFCRPQVSLLPFTKILRNALHIRHKV